MDEEDELTDTDSELELEIDTDSDELLEGDTLSELLELDREVLSDDELLEIDTEELELLNETD